ncbi:hypothetical protein B0T16DRAFT_335973 [Cercophora newfieldiana]|uniref:Uncharacterized protein n=1 Tax=Cercophora newfieldiana TaxID=92897 RepID=A0AA39XXT3_9PEZI|nr:hypothetical protein B0T16DRAFT_335973 [Cercophora newfieldiana]
MRIPSLLLTAGLAPAALSSVVILPGGAPKPFVSRRANALATTPDAFFNGSAENEFLNSSAKVLFSSLDTMKPALSAASNLYPSGDSFIRGAIQAWGEHLHLVIRPEEVWFTILVQMNFYMNAHAEEIRSMFVDHNGQEVIYIEDFTWYDVLRRFQFAIQERVKTKWLLEWIRPNFTTTTENDVMVANVLMMGLTQAYFKFEGGIVCGLPSVTLLGEESDWEQLLEKTERLKEFGAEPAEYAKRLKPILTRFVRSFREPDSKEIVQFWNNIAVAHRFAFCGSPPVSITGWIVGFYYWQADGTPYARVSTNAGDSVNTMDNITYPVLDITKLPIGYARAPFIMRDFADEERFEAFVAAGAMGKTIKPGPPAGYADALKRTGGDLSLLDEGKKNQHSTLQPMSSWMLYGPSPHNATTTQWWQEEELFSDLAAGLMQTVPHGGSCRAKY